MRLSHERSDLWLKPIYQKVSEIRQFCELKSACKDSLLPWVTDLDLNLLVKDQLLGLLCNVRSCSGKRSEDLCDPRRKWQTRQQTQGIKCIPPRHEPIQGFHFNTVTSLLFMSIVVFPGIGILQEQPYEVNGLVLSLMLWSGIITFPPYIQIFCTRILENVNSLLSLVKDQKKLKLFSAYSQVKYSIHFHATQIQSIITQSIQFSFYLLSFKIILMNQSFILHEL